MDIVEEYKPHLEQVLRFAMRPDDVTVMSFPKSGTTWVQEIVWLICNDADINAANATSLFQRYGIFDTREVPQFDVFRGLGSLNAWPTNKRRFIKTHLPFELQPTDLQRCPQGKIIYVVRNPKDTCVSFYHMHRMQLTLPEPGTWNEFLDKFNHDQVTYGSWFKHVTTYWKLFQERKDSMYFVAYESLKADLKLEVSKLAKFLDKNPSENQIDAIVQHCSFDEMSKNDKTNWSEFSERGGWDFNASKFMRKGQVGDWKNYFTVSQSEAFDEIMKKRFKGCDLKFQYDLDLPLG